MTKNCFCFKISQSCYQSVIVCRCCKEDDKLSLTNYGEYKMINLTVLYFDTQIIAEQKGNFWFRVQTEWNK